MFVVHKFLVVNLLLIFLNCCICGRSSFGRSRSQSHYSSNSGRSASSSNTYKHTTDFHRHDQQQLSYRKPTITHTTSRPIGWNVEKHNSNNNKVSSNPLGSYNTGHSASRPIGWNVGHNDNNNNKVNNNPLGPYNTGHSTSRPIGWNVGHNDNNNKVTNNPLGSYNTGHSTSRPIGWNVGHNDNNNKVSNNPLGSTNNGHLTSHPLGWNTNHNKPLINDAHHSNNNAQGISQSFNTNNQGWNIPARPGVGVHHQAAPGFTHQIPHSGPAYSGPSHVQIVNKYNYHYPGYYSLPAQNTYHPGYYSTPSYHYTSIDTGNSALGFALGYSLAKLTTPTYSHQSFFDGYRPRYDHYTVHHYYHNSDSVPKNQEIQSNTIVGCVGDAPSVCPVNTTSLCTSNGNLMCVVNNLLTSPCIEKPEVNCIKSKVACVQNSTECNNSKTNETSINIPCVSKVKIYGDLKYLNNTILSVNNNNATGNTSVILNTAKENMSLNATINPESEFCITVIALPAEKTFSAGEEVFKDAKTLTADFFKNVWGI